MKILDRLKKSAYRLKKDVTAVYLAYRRPEVPWYAKVLGALVVGYALSPIDLIPDFIPILGYLDDLVLIPLGIALVVRLIPVDVMSQCREQAAELFKSGKPKNWVAGAVIAVIWIAVVALVIYKIFF